MSVIQDFVDKVLHENPRPEKGRTCGLFIFGLLSRRSEKSFTSAPSTMGYGFAKIGSVRTGTIFIRYSGCHAGPLLLTSISITYRSRQTHWSSSHRVLSTLSESQSPTTGFILSFQEDFFETEGHSVNLFQDCPTLDPAQFRPVLAVR